MIATHKMMLCALIPLFILAACEGTTVDGTLGDDDGGLQPGQEAGTQWDFGVSYADGGGACPCPKGQVCYNSRCFTDMGPCSATLPCQGDSFCHKGRCVPFGPGTKQSDPTCKNKGFTPEALKAPKLRCAWTKDDVRMSPMVADLDGDKKPEIIFIAWSGKLTVIRGDTCAQVWQMPTKYYLGSNPAIGDLDGDKKPEIVVMDSSDRIVVHDNTGKIIAKATDKPKRTYSEKSGGPAIANLDGKGNAEIVYGGLALSYSGGKLTTLFNQKVHGGYRGVFSAVADVDLDGKPDIISGNRILNGQTGADKTPPAMAKLTGGHVAIAQFDKTTPEPEVVLVTSHGSKVGTIRIVNPKSGKTIFGPYNFGKENGGPPTVADFDGDGEPEVAAAGYVGYAVFDMECAAKPLPAFCHSAGMRWFKVTQDKSSGCTGSSVFDFNGDGKAEVVYRDECWLRVYDGTTGKIRFATGVSSGTKMELPVVADVNNDGHANIVVASDDYYSCSTEKELGLKHPGKTRGIMVFQDPQNRWMPSRSIWNQHTYHITNVNDDATIPVKEKDNWKSWNNYRQNTQGILKTEIKGSDLTGKQQLGVEPGSDCVKNWVLKAAICNRGAAPSGAAVKGTFYKGDPRKAGATALCTAATKGKLAVGACEVVKCNYANPAKGPIDLWFKADDDGKGGNGAEVECKEDNNLLHMPGATCPGGVN